MSKKSNAKKAGSKKPANGKKVQCTVCGKEYSPLGIASHRKSCVKKSTQKQAKTGDASDEGKKKNAGQWKPGESGNPNGRPTFGTAWSEVLRGIGDEVPDVNNKDGTPNTKTYKELVGRKLWSQALKGDPRAIKEIGDRIEGKSVARIDANIHDGVDWEELAERRERQREEMEKKRPASAKEAKALAQKRIKEKGL